VAVVAAWRARWSPGAAAGKARRELEEGDDPAAEMRDRRGGGVGSGVEKIMREGSERRGSMSGAVHQGDRRKGREHNGVCDGR
jgi:hypothetical protein